MLETIKIIVNIMVGLLLIAGVITIIVYETGIGIMLLLMAMLFIMFLKWNDTADKLEELKVISTSMPIMPQEDIVPPEEPKFKPEPKLIPKPEPVFKCKTCGKEFPEEKKLKRHFGMSHYQDLEV